nr:2Fe-2S iron-sulfur cluster-binding protein [Bradyrhizobium japonicum]
MVAAIRHGVAGINGDCGGSMDCATCHVYLDEAQSKLVPPQPVTKSTCCRLSSPSEGRPAA